ARFKGHGGRSGGLLFSPDGRRLASGTDERDGPVHLWDVEAQKPLPPLKDSNGDRPVLFSPDSRLLVAAGPDEGDVRVWDARTGKELRRLGGRWPIAFTHD